MAPQIDFPTFRPRPPWLGGDLQTLRNFVLKAAGRGLPDLPGTRLFLPIGNGGDDRLAARLTRGREGRPLVVLIHGLTGCETSFNVIASAWHFHRLGYPVLWLNLRGAGPSRPTSRGYYHAGRTDDLADALSSLDPQLTPQGLLLVGFSLGGNMLLKFLAEHANDFPIRAAGVVSVPIDLAASSRCIMRPRNALYHRWILDRMKRDCLAGDLSAAERITVIDAATVYEFDDRFVAPRNGFAGADDYYARCRALRFLDEVHVPTLVLHADDDPWIPVASYRGYDWSRNANLTLLLARGGGHVGFHALGDSVPWHNRCLGRFFGAISES